MEIITELRVQNLRLVQVRAVDVGLPGAAVERAERQRGDQQEHVRLRRRGFPQQRQRLRGQERRRRRLNEQTIGRAFTIYVILIYLGELEMHDTAIRHFALSLP